MAKKRRAFTLVEAMLASFIALYVILGSWGVSIMVWKWWKDTAPEIEQQRIARTAISVLVNGIPDATAGTFSANSVTYKRRNGIAWATYAPDIPIPPTRINFRLAPDVSNVRSFYMGEDPASGLNVIYYLDNSGSIHKIDATLGITNIAFERYLGYSDTIKITATAGNVTYSDVVFLRNIA